MIAFVTGGAGFIGSHVVDRLRARGVEARIYDLVKPRWRTDVEHIHASILDLDALTAAMKGADVVLHLAAVADVKDVFERPDYAESINTRGTLNVLEAARRNRVRKVIFGSTVWVYSEVPEQVVDEATPLPPPNHLYTATKIAAEYYCRSYQKLYGLTTAILRYGIPYGPRARDGAVIPTFVQRALGGEPLVIAGDGSQWRRFVYVEDLAEGNVLAIRDVADNKTYNLDGTERVTIRQLAETIRRILGNVEIRHVEGRPGDFSGKEVRSERARLELGWEPRVTLEDGIRRYIEWYRSTLHQREVVI